MAKHNVMSARGFLAKLSTKAANSALGFIQAHREFLTTGEVSIVTSPIIARLDSGELLPTPAKHEIAAAVMGHIIAIDQAKMEEAIERASEPKAQKTWMARILDAKGELVYVNGARLEGGGYEQIALEQSFEHAQRADGWVDRRLFEGAPDWYGEVEGLGTHVHVERADSIARILKQPKGPAIHQRAVTTKTLGFGVKVHQTRVSFSRG
jgi:hypothetical protein